MLWLKYFLFSECDNKTFGQECTGVCGNCLENEPCHHINGSCLHGCDPGFNGLKCDQGLLLNYENLESKIVTYDYHICQRFMIIWLINDLWWYSIFSDYRTVAVKFWIIKINNIIIVYNIAIKILENYASIKFDTQFLR